MQVLPLVDLEVLPVDFLKLHVAPALVAGEVFIVTAAQEEVVAVDRERVGRTHVDAALRCINVLEPILQDSAAPHLLCRSHHPRQDVSLEHHVWVDHHAPAAGDVHAEVACTHLVPRDVVVNSVDLCAHPAQPFKESAEPVVYRRLAVVVHDDEPELVTQGLRVRSELLKLPSQHIRLPVDGHDDR